MKPWVRIAIVVALGVVLWYLVANLTKSLSGGPPTPPPAAQPSAPGQTQ